MDFNNELYNKIIIPFFNEVQFRNKYNENINFSDLNFQIGRIIDKKSLYNLINEKINSINIEELVPSLNNLKEIRNYLFKIELYFNRLCIELEQNLNDELKKIFLKLLNFQIFLSSYNLDYINDINIYFEFGEKILNLYKTNFNEINLSDKKDINDLRRSLYWAIHESRFETKESFFNDVFNYIKEDFEFSKSYNQYDYIIALENYININLDHIFYCYEMSFPPNYIDITKFEKNILEYKKQLYDYIIEKNNKDNIFSLLSTLFRIELYKLKLVTEKNQKISNEFKSHLLLKCAELIKIFYNNSNNYIIFFKDLTKENIDFKDSLKKFSEQLAILLNDNNKNIINILFIIFNLFQNFSEYLKLNINIYKKIIFVSKKFYNRKIYLLSNMVYLKSLQDNIDIFKQYIVKIKKSVESNPAQSLITLYNNQIISMKKIPQELKNYYKINPMVIQIYEKIYTVNKNIYNEIEDFKNKKDTINEFDTRLSYISNFLIEMKNIISFAQDPYLIRDLAQIYINFIDSYIKNNDLEYREDYIKKTTILKMSILDVNPLNFAYALLYSKLGKLKLIMEHEDPKKLVFRKKMLTNIEKEEMSKYIQISQDILPRNEPGVDWDYVSKAIENFNKPSLTKDFVSPPESRILKVISSLINKIARQDESPSKLFLNLYEESYNYTKKEWDLDPVLLYYFNAYLAKKGILILYNENNGIKFELTFTLLKNPSIIDKINLFLRDIIENTHKEKNELIEQMDDLIKMSMEPLIDDKNNKKPFSYLDVKRIFNTNKAIFFEKNYIDIDDKIYLIDILKNFLQLMAKNSINNTIIFCIEELIDFANRLNLKREFFKNKNIDFEQKYSIGIIHFNENYEKIKLNLIELVKQDTLKVKIVFIVQNNNLTIQIFNNYKYHNEEINFLNNLIVKSKKINNIKEIYNYQFNTREEKTQGLFLMILLLRKIGLEDTLKVNLQENETSISFKIPYIYKFEDKDDQISQEIVKIVEDIPMIPEHINKLKLMINNRDFKIEDIEKLILQDPSLTAEVIKVSNSAFYMLSKPITNIKDAIKVIGSKGLSNILLITNSYKILQNKTTKEKVEEIILHSEKTAFFAKKLLNLKELSSDTDDIYLATLLHDIGKIIVLGLQPDVYEKIQLLIENKQLTPDIIENLSFGLNHSLIGYLIAKKWNFPEIIQEVIKFHHNPRESKGYPEPVFIVYLANALTHFVNKKLLFENIDSNVLDFFEINNKEKITEIANKINSEYIAFHNIQTSKK